MRKTVWPTEIAIIVAVARNNVIGYQGKIPWHSSWDLKQFKAITSHAHHEGDFNTLIMGRKTFESIGRPLPGRETIVVSRNPGLVIEGCKVASSIEDAIRQAQGYKIFICGGEEIYRAAMPRVTKFYVTYVDLETPGDAFFPGVPEPFSATAAHHQAPSDRKEGEPACYTVEYEHIIPGLDT